MVVKWGVATCTILGLDFGGFWICNCLLPKQHTKATLRNIGNWLVAHTQNAHGSGHVRHFIFATTVTLALPVLHASALRVVQSCNCGQQCSATGCCRLVDNPLLTGKPSGPAVLGHRLSCGWRPVTCHSLKDPERLVTYIHMPLRLARQCSQSATPKLKNSIPKLELHYSILRTTRPSNSAGQTVLGQSINITDRLSENHAQPAASSARPK